MKRPRRVLRLVVFSLLLGVVTTYGVAWAVANVPPRDDPRLWIGNIMSSEGEPGWSPMVEDRFGITTCSSLVVVPLGHEGSERSATWSVIRGKSPSELVGATSRGIDSCVFERLAGWPARATMERSYYPPHPAGPTSISGHDRTVHLNAGANPVVTLAFLPVWPGVAIDIAFYSMVWIVVPRVVGAAWRLRRPG